jgi:hypothetical protein
MNYWYWRMQSANRLRICPIQLDLSVAISAPLNWIKEEIMKPTKKAVAVEKFLNTMTVIPRMNAIENNVCALCGKDASKFKDEISVREFAISGLCQSCQDEVFG